MPKNILIIEDEVFISMMLEDTVEKFGYKVLDKLRYGEEVMEKIDGYKNKPDLICSDIYLAGEINGIEVAKLVKEKYDIPIIFMSAFSDEETIKEAKEVDYYDYMFKPIDEEKFLQTLKKLFGEE
ncbi:MAG: two-component system response regulator [Bacteroidetes bacterium]|nr:response regulator [Bacteroidia bacterium]PCH68145.1 MAG: two-component system response regulator [Bacteroidota bacterium]